MPRVRISGIRSTLRQAVTALAALAILAAVVGVSSRSPGPGRAAGSYRAYLPAIASDAAGRAAVTTVRSDDGSADLAIPAGALPDGVEPGDIKITRLANPQDEATIDGQGPAVGYRFEPEGLQFKTPATLTVRGIDPGVGRVRAFLLSADGSLTLLDTMADAAAGGSAAIQSRLPHFSFVLFSTDRYGGAGGAVLSGVPKELAVGQSFTASAGVTYLKETVVVKDANGYTYTVHFVKKTLHGEFEVSQNGSVLDPNLIANAPPQTAIGDQFVAKGTFTCVRPGSAAVDYYAHLSEEHEPIGFYPGVFPETLSSVSEGRTGPQLVRCKAPPVLKTLGCAPGAKVNQLIACRSDAAPSSPDSPLTLVAWVAPEGTPSGALGTTGFTTMFTTPGPKQIGLKVCSGEVCTNLTTTVNVQADDTPPLTIPAPPSQVRCQTGIIGAVITWTDASNNETGFHIYQRTETSQVLRGSESANAAAHSEPNGACNGAPYGVASFNAAGESNIVWQGS